MAAKDLTAGTGVRAESTSRIYKVVNKIDCTKTPITNADGAMVVKIPAWHVCQTVDLRIRTKDSGGAYTCTVGKTVGGTEWQNATAIGSGATNNTLIAGTVSRQVASATSTAVYFQPSSDLSVAVFDVIATVEDNRSLTDLDS